MFNYFITNALIRISLVGIKSFIVLLKIIITLYLCLLGKFGTKPIYSSIYFYSYFSWVALVLSDMLLLYFLTVMDKVIERGINNTSLLPTFMNFNFHSYFKCMNFIEDLRKSYLFIPVVFSFYYFYVSLLILIEGIIIINDFHKLFLFIMSMVSIYGNIRLCFNKVGYWNKYSLFSYLASNVVFNEIEFFTYINLWLLSLLILLMTFFILIYTTLFSVTSSVCSDDLLEFIVTVGSLVILFVVISPSLLLLFDTDISIRSNVLINILGVQWAWESSLKILSPKEPTTSNTKSTTTTTTILNENENVVNENVVNENEEQDDNAGNVNEPESKEELEDLEEDSSSSFNSSSNLGSSSFHSFSSFTNDEVIILRVDENGKQVWLNDEGKWVHSYVPRIIQKSEEASLVQQKVNYGKWKRFWASRDARDKYTAWVENWNWEIYVARRIREIRERKRIDKVAAAFEKRVEERSWLQEQLKRRLNSGTNDFSSSRTGTIDLNVGTTDLARASGTTDLARASGTTDLNASASGTTDLNASASGTTDWISGTSGTTGAIEQTSFGSFNMSSSSSSFELPTTTIKGTSFIDSFFINSNEIEVVVVGAFFMITKNCCINLEPVIASMLTNGWFLLLLQVLNYLWELFKNNNVPRPRTNGNNNNNNNNGPSSWSSLFDFIYSFYSVYLNSSNQDQVDDVGVVVNGSRAITAKDLNDDVDPPKVSLKLSLINSSSSSNIMNKDKISSFSTSLLSLNEKTSINNLVKIFVSNTFHFIIRSVNIIKSSMSSSIFFNNGTTIIPSFDLSLIEFSFLFDWIKDNGTIVDIGVPNNIYLSCSLSNSNMNKSSSDYQDQIISSRVTTRRVRIRLTQSTHSLLDSNINRLLVFLVFIFNDLLEVLMKLRCYYSSLLGFIAVFYQANQVDCLSKSQPFYQCNLIVNKIGFWDFFSGFIPVPSINLYCFSLIIIELWKSRWNLFCLYWNRSWNEMDKRQVMNTKLRNQERTIGSNLLNDLSIAGFNKAQDLNIRANMFVPYNRTHQAFNTSHFFSRSDNNLLLLEFYNKESAANSCLYGKLSSLEHTDLSKDSSEEIEDQRVKRGTSITDQRIMKFPLNTCSSYLIIPYHSIVKTVVSSRDVVHSFGVYSLGVKVDAIPGKFNLLFSVKPLIRGIFKASCYELCGLNHTSMIANLLVV